MQLQRKKDIVHIDKEWLYARVSQLSVYQYYVPSIQIGKYVKSPIRHDKSPSWSIIEKEGNVIWRDWGTDEGGSIMTLVQKLYNINYDQALTRIATDMQLIDKDGADTRMPIVRNPDTVPATKHYCLIQVAAKRFNQHELEYWADYGITEAELRADDVHSVREWFLNRVKQQIVPKERVFAYKYDQGFQILMPDRSKLEKWKTNMPLNYLDGWDKVNGCDKVLITKAKKDKIYLQKLLPFPVIRTMNESISAFTPEIVEKLRGKQVWVNFDNDSSGKKASYRVTELLKCKHLNCPDALLSEKITDFSDWHKARKSDREVVEFLKLKGLID